MTCRISYAALATVLLSSCRASPPDSQPAGDSTAVDSTRASVDSMVIGSDYRVHFLFYSPSEYFPNLLRDLFDTDTTSTSGPTPSALVNKALLCESARPGFLRGVVKGIYTPPTGATKEIFLKGVALKIGFYQDGIPISPVGFDMGGQFGHFQYEFRSIPRFAEATEVMIGVVDSRIEAGGAVLVAFLPLQVAESQCILEKVRLTDSLF